MRRSLAIAVMLLGAMVRVTTAGPPPEVAVTTCGQIVPNRTIGYLTADLDCTGFTGSSPNVYGQALGATVLLGRKSQLDLRGFTLTAGRTGVVCDGLICGDDGEPCSTGPCEVFGGTIVASSSSDVGVTGVRPVLQDLKIENGFNIGVVVFGKGILTNVTVTACHDNGVQGSGGEGKRRFGLLKVVDSTITGNGRFGIFSSKGLTVTSSIVTGNGAMPGCIAALSCGDLTSGTRPHVAATTCNTSVGGPDGTWGVCSLD